LAVVVDIDSKCPDCGADLRSNGNRYGRKQFYCIGRKTHYHRSGTTAHDHKSGRHSGPSQASWLVGKHGEFDRTNFQL